MRIRMTGCWRVSLVRQDLDHSLGGGDSSCAAVSEEGEHSLGVSATRSLRHELVP